MKITLTTTNTKARAIINAFQAAEAAGADAFAAAEAEAIRQGLKPRQAAEAAATVELLLMTRKPFVLFH